MAVAPPKRTDAEVEAIRTKLAQHRRLAGNVKSEGAQALLSVVAASLGRTRSDLTSGRLTTASFATSLTPSELRQRVHLWMDALDQLGFSGNMLYYHIHLVARKLECEHAHRGEAVNIMARYWRYAGWHLPSSSSPTTMAGFDAWIHYIIKLDVTGDAWEFTKAFNTVFQGCDKYMYQSTRDHLIATTCQPSGESMALFASQNTTPPLPPFPPLSSLACAFPTPRAVLVGDL